MANITYYVQSMITNETPCYYVEFKPITEAKNLSIVQKVVFNPKN